MVRVRFAPSPTGSLHLGAVRTAVLNWLFVRSEGGELVLRIDDTDVARSRPEHEQEILVDLRWLGIEWGSGPVRQSERASQYGEALDQLEQSGAVYERDGALWFRVPDRALSYEDLIRGRIEAPAGAVKDFVVRRSDGTPTYNFATAVDDMGLEITHILRGEDHISNTPLQILVAEALGGQAPAFAHLPLLLGPDGSKLSKRHGAGSIEDYRKGGYLPEALVNYLALVSVSMGEDEVLSPQELVELFALDNVHRSPARFDAEKLRWLNGQHLRGLGLDEFGEKLAPFLGREANRAELQALQTAGATLSECADVASLFDSAEKLDRDAKDAIAADGAAYSLEVLASALPDGRLDAEDAKQLLSDVRGRLKDEGISPKISMKAVRAALTGTVKGPELQFFVAALEPDELQRRLNR